MAEQRKDHNFKFRRRKKNAKKDNFTPCSLLGFTTSYLYVVKNVQSYQVTLYGSAERARLEDATSYIDFEQTLIIRRPNTRHRDREEHKCFYKQCQDAKHKTQLLQDNEMNKYLADDNMASIFY